MAFKLTEDMHAEVDSFIKATDPDTVRFCTHCGKECKKGQMLWNGWFCYEGLYHFDCVPQELKERFGLK